MTHADLGTTQHLSRAAAWPAAADALLSMRTLTVLRDRSDTAERGSVITITGELNRAALRGNALHRLAVLEVATRLDAAERSADRLALAHVAKNRYIAAEILRNLALTGADFLGYGTSQGN